MGRGLAEFGIALYIGAIVHAIFGGFTPMMILAFVLYLLFRLKG